VSRWPHRIGSIPPFAIFGQQVDGAVHVKVRRGGAELLTTQMYVAGEPLNARDGLYRRLDPGERARVTVALSPAPGIEADALAGTFEIVVPA
jgi:protocatechuate 3,4-dioxygenase, beta subunit